MHLAHLATARDVQQLIRRISILEHAGNELNSNGSNVGRNTHAEGEGSESSGGGGGCGGAGQGEGRTHISTTCLSPGPHQSQDYKDMGVSSPVDVRTTSPVYFYVNVDRSPNSSHHSKNSRPLTAGVGCRKQYRRTSAMGEGGSGGAGMGGGGEGGGGGVGGGESVEFGLAALSVRKALLG